MYNLIADSSSTLWGTYALGYVMLHSLNGGR